MGLSHECVEGSLQIETEMLHQEEFRYLKVSFMSGGRMEGEIDRQISSASVWSVVVKREMSQLPVDLCCMVTGLWQ